MTVNIVGVPSPFASDALHAEAPEGLTVAEMVLGRPGPVDLPYGLVVFIDDRQVPQAALHLVRPKAGTTVTVRAVPQDGGGGGGEGKSTLRTVLTIAVIAAALIIGPYVGAALFGVPATTAVVGAVTAGQIGTALVGTAGLLAVNAIAPPRVPNLTGGGLSDHQDTSSPNFSIEGARNALQPFGVIPSVLGRHRMVPPLGARTFTEVSGDDQFLRMLVIWGYGPLKVSDIRIGETPIGAFDGVQIETREGRPGDAPLTLYPDTVTEEALAIALSERSGFHQRTTEPETDEISVDITWPGGLFRVDDQGRRTATQVSIQVQFAPAGTGVFITQATLDISEARTSAVRRNLTWAVDRGRYDVRIRRTTSDSSDTQTVDAAVWTALRSFTNADPVTFDKPLARSALRIKGSDQLNRVIDQLNGMVESEVLDWNGSAWVAAVSRNPASLYRHVLQGPANANPRTDAELDLDQLQAWHAFCATNGLTFNHIRDYEGGVRQALDDIASAGRAATALRDGKWGVVIDREQSTIVQHFSPRNSFGYRGEKVFEAFPHAWRIRFVNELNDYRQDERIVYDDGFSEANATQFEGLELPGVTDPDQVWKLGRYHIATGRLRPERHVFHADLEHLVATRGDLIRLSHDVPAFGLAQGRVKSVIDDGGSPANATAVTVDEPAPMEAGKSYAARFRLSDGRSLLANVVTDPGEQTQLTFVTPIALTDAPAPGDLILFGELGTESAEMIVKSIEPADELTARIVCVDHAPAIFQADQGTIPAFNSQITLPPNIGLAPSQPVIGTIQSDLSVAVRQDSGAIQERIVVTTSPPQVFDPAQVFLEAQLRPQGADDYGSSITQALGTQVTIADVIGGEVYDIRIRRVAGAASPAPGAASDWTETLGYQVIGKTDLPADVTTLQLELDRAVWEYVPPLDFKGFQLRFHRGGRRTWSDATPIHEGFVTETEFGVSFLRGGTFTLLVKAFDSGNRESANPAVLVVDLGDPIVDNVILSIDYAAFGFGLSDGRGQVTGGALDGGELRATDTALFWTGNGDQLFWTGDGSATFWGSVFAPMTYDAFHVPATADLGVDVSLETDVAGETVSISYRGSGSEDFWGSDEERFWPEDDTAPFWPELPPFRAWPGKFAPLERQKYTFRVETSGGSVRGIVAGFAVRLDVPDILERLDDVAIGASGSRLPITRTYRRIQNVSLTLQDDAGAAVTVRTKDKSAAAGPLVEALDNAGAGTTATVDAVVQGF